VKPVKVFWDLEETCLTSWEEGLLCNVSKLREWVADNHVTEVTVFSAAVYDERDKEVFNRDFKQMLESAFGVTVVDCLTYDDVRKVVCKEHRMQLDLHEFISLWGKQRGFHDYCMTTMTDCTAVLVDDCVGNMTTVFHDKNLTVELVRVAFGKPLRNVC